MVKTDLDKVILEALNDPVKGRNFFDSFRREMYDILRIATNHPQGLLTPEQLDLLPDRYTLAKILACAELLESRGNKMMPTHYVITQKGREIYKNF